MTYFPIDTPTDTSIGTLNVRRKILAAVLFALLAIAPRTTLAEEQKPFVGMANDGWFHLSEVETDTWAISEPDYWQHNISYLIRGKDRALLFDSGSPSDDITFVLGFLTDLPITTLASHVHYDHIGSHGRMQKVAMTDLPENRANMDGNVYRTNFDMSLTWPSKTFEVHEWVAPGDVIDLGGRKLEVVHTPGHSVDSIVLVDRSHGAMFVGDHIYPGPLVAFTPGTDLDAYLRSTQRLLADYPEIEKLYCAHNGSQMPASALADLASALEAVLGGASVSKRLWWSGWMLKEHSFPNFAILTGPGR